MNFWKKFQKNIKIKSFWKNFQKLLEKIFSVI